MKTVQSTDGTAIAFDQLGRGPALILVDGALGQRAMNGETMQLAPLLAEHFTVFHYDRRGRGDSTDEMGEKVKKLAMYEDPYNDEEAARQAWKTYRKQLADVLARGRRGDALALFMMLVGMPSEHLDAVRQHPLWPMWEAAATTLAYDAAVMGEDASVPTEKATRVAVPTLVMDGEASFPFMHVTALTLANAIPHARHRTLLGQTHEVEAAVLAPVLVQFFTSNRA
jgi:pimeloyl-ACP methyl ester carboxylesterase